MEQGRRNHPLPTQLQRNHPTITKTIYIYIPPSESPYYSEDTLSTLEEETSHFQAQGNVLICGDLNARTGLQPDFTDTQGSKYINNKLLLTTLSPISTEITMTIQ